MRSSARGFSLIEILVVVTIIVVLASILMPVANQVRTAAKSAQCMSNLRQFGTAFATYAYDNHGSVIPCGADPGCASVAGWASPTFPDSYWVDPWILGTCMEDYARQISARVPTNLHSIFRCPADSPPNPSLRVSYGMSASICPWVSIYLDPPKTGYAGLNATVAWHNSHKYNMANFRAPLAQVSVLTDVAYSTIWDCYAHSVVGFDPTFTGWQGKRWIGRHNNPNGCNVLYADGRVSYLYAPPVAEMIGDLKPVPF